MTKKMTKNTTYRLALTAIASAMLAILAQISIPIGPVPFTLQTLAIGWIATVLKPREATLSVALYLLLGAIGLPVFAGGAAGFQALVGPTAGFLWTFLIYAWVTSSLTDMTSSYLRIFLANLLGIAIVLSGGAIYFKFFMSVSWTQSFTLTVTPFILTGILKIIVVAITSKLLYPFLKREPYFKSR